jgi:hypothetical protein
MEYIESIGFTPKILKLNKKISVCHAPSPPPPLTEICATPTA